MSSSTTFSALILSWLDSIYYQSPSRTRTHLIGFLIKKGQSLIYFTRLKTRILSTGIKFSTALLPFPSHYTLLKKINGQKNSQVIFSLKCSISKITKHFRNPFCSLNFFQWCNSLSYFFFHYGCSILTLLSNPAYLFTMYHLQSDASDHRLQ